MTDTKHTFSKAERLCSQKLIEALFAGGNKSFSAYPIRAVFMPIPYSEGAPRIQLLISVSKRHFRHAVDRNRVKRQLREAYRLNKQLLINELPEDRSLALAFLWLSNEHFPSSVIHEKVKKILDKVAQGTGSYPLPPQG